MTGLNVITDAILSKAQKEAAEITDKAQADFDKSIEEAKALVKKESDEAFAAAREKAEGIMSAAKSAAEQKVKLLMLEKKSQLIKSTKELAEKKVYELDRASYAKLLEKLLDTYARENADGEIVFSKSDINDIPKLLEEKIKVLGLKVSENTGDFSGGFILKYGQIEENCTISAIFDDNSEKITDYLNKKLFG